ncbi:MAG: hypothetical protein HWN66_02190 [Candidatus Helarchaeota archaeon]|nr:hypothetical protein [Candidatus Helarchaeota archaeon]
MEEEWEKVEEKPEKKFKVEGYYLLNQRAKIEELERNLQEEKAARAETEGKINSLQSEMELHAKAFEGKIHDQGQFLEAQKAEIDKLTNERNTMSANLNTLQNNNSALKTQVDELTNQASGIDEEVTRLIQENEELTTKLNQLEASGQSASELQQVLDQKDGEIANLTHQIQELNKKLGAVGAKPFKLAQPPPASAEDLLDTKPQPPRPAFAHPAPSQAPPTPEFAPKAPAGKPSWTCPNCESNRVVEESDRSKILYIAAGRPIYGKKRRCLKCNHEWAA